MIYSYSKLTDSRRSYNPAPWLSEIMSDQSLIFDGGDFVVLESNSKKVGAGIRDIVSRYNITNIKIDLSMNPVRLSDPRLTEALPWLNKIAPTTVLHTDYSIGNKLGPVYKFFPTIFWIYNTRYSEWAGVNGYEAGELKTRPLMCLNRQPRAHRILLFNEFHRRKLFEHCDYSFVFQISGVDSGYENHLLDPPDFAYFSNIIKLVPMLLPDEKLKYVTYIGDVSVNKHIYQDCAVNLVTETTANMPWFSEKICKPFVANQIPIILGPAGINDYLKSIGLDMFEDLVPWRTWDNILDVQIKVKLIVQFVEKWLLSGTILQDYYNVIDRVRSNKTYFHSQDFRNKVMPTF